MKSLIHMVMCGLGTMTVVAPMLHDNLGWNSGTRLQAVYLQGSDNSGYPTGAFYDTVKQENCSFQTASDSQGNSGVYCLGPSFFQGTTTSSTVVVSNSPPAASDCAMYQEGSNNYYADAKCTQALAYASYGDSPDCAIATSADSVPNIEYTLGADVVYSPPAIGSYATLGGTNRMGSDQLEATPIYSVQSDGSCKATTTLCNLVANDGQDCNVEWNYDWWIVGTTPATQTTESTSSTVYPSLTEYVKAARQVNVRMDGKGNVVGTN